MGKLKEKFWESIVNNIASLIFMPIGVAILSIAKIIPTEVIKKIDAVILFWIAVGLFVICILLIAYAIYLHPRYRYLPDYGVYQDIRKGIYFCPTCKSNGKNSPLQEFSSNFYCNSCRYRYDFPESLKPKTRRVVSPGVNYFH